MVAIMANLVVAMVTQIVRACCVPGCDCGGIHPWWIHCNSGAGTPLPIIMIHGYTLWQEHLDDLYFHHCHCAMATKNVAVSHCSVVDALPW